MPIHELLEEACRAATEVLEIDAAAASQISDDGNSLELRAEYGWPHRGGTAAPATAWIRARRPRHTLLTGKPLLVQDWDEETTLHASRAADSSTAIKSSIGVRIEGPVHPWGVFGAFSRRPHAFSEHDVNFVVSLANILADAIERQDAEDAMQHRALHDPLTGLPNRVSSPTASSRRSSACAGTPARSRRSCSSTSTTSSRSTTRSATRPATTC